MKRLISLLFSLLFIIAVFTGCDSKKSYTVLIKSDNSPYSYFQDNNAMGLEADILNAIGEEQGFTVEYVDNKDGQYISCSNEFTEESDSYDYTNPYFQKGIIFVTSDTNDVSAYEDLLHSTIGVMKDSYGEEFATQIAPQYNITIKTYKDREEMYTDGESQNIAGFFDDELIAKSSIKNGRSLKTFENAEKTQSLSFAVNKGQQKEFVEAFNKGLEKIMSNGKYEKIIEKY